MKKIILPILSLFIMKNIAISQTVIPLYKGAIPNSKPSKDEEKVEMRDGIEITSKISRPTLKIFLPAKEKATGAAVVICPGGGYGINASSHEGTDVAKEFVKSGIAAIVLKYRIPNDETMIDRTIGPLQDAQQAIKTVREKAKEWNINPGRIGIMGFSAGGHLASTAGTHFNKAVIENKEGTSLRPDFQILVYPVINFNDPSIAHRGSAEQLLGKNATADKLKEYSNELNVTDQTPPTFLVHASDDDGVKPNNSIVFYEALLQHHVPAELHIYQNSGHGFGMKLKNSKEWWMDTCKNWMAANGWLK
ncbi:MAG: alpha/beta hydrolase [Ferruginibacter sp.]